MAPGWRGHRQPGTWPGDLPSTSTRSLVWGCREEGNGRLTRRPGQLGRPPAARCRRGPLKSADPAYPTGRPPDRA